MLARERVLIRTVTSPVILLFSDFANTYSQVVIDANDGTKGVVRFHFNSTKVEATEKEVRALFSQDCC